MTHAVSTSLLLERFQRVTASFAARPGALAMLGLGSAGIERARLDRYSDLDFFAIAEPDAVPGLIESPDWLHVGAPLVFLHRNTPDGWKAVWADGVMAEFAVFAPQRLADIPFAPGEIVWQAPHFDPSCLPRANQPGPSDPTWLAREALSCLYVGLGRYWRGEVLAAHALIAGSAVDLLLAASGPASDPFNPRRRAELARPDAPGLVSESHLRQPLPELASHLLNLARSLGADPQGQFEALIAARLEGAG